MHVGMKEKALSRLMTFLLLISMFVINFPVNTQAQETQYVTVYVGDNVARLTGDNAPKPSFEEPRGDIIPLTKVKYEAGDTAFTVLLKAAKTAGLTVDYSNEQNVNGIDGLSTYDGGKMSGWMVDVNGPFLNVAASAFPIQPNDYVEWQYSCSWGSDIGADWMAPLSNRISKIKMLEGSLSPKFDPDNLNYSFLVDNTTQSIQLHPVLENGLGKDGSLKKVEITSQGISYKSYQSIPVKNDTDIVIKVGEAGDNLKYTIKIKDINSEINGLETWLKDYVKSVFEDAPAGEIVSPAEYNWPTIGLARLGNYEGLDKYLAENEKYLAKKENWDKLKRGVKVTEFERMSLAIGAAKGNPRDFAGKDIIAEIYNFPAVAYNGYPEFAQGTNGAIFALIAIDSMRYEIPKDAVWSRDKMINAILNNQLPDGGFALSKATSGAKSDPDLTAMAIQALAPYKDDAAKPEVKSAIDKAVEYLGVSQQSDGGYKSVSSESTSQAIIALCSIGIDIDTDPRFIKTTNSLLSNILTFRAEDGGFKHLLNSGSNSMASEQALLAFASYVRFKTNQQTLYDYHAESAKDIADGINSVSAPAAEATRLTMPTVPEGFTIAIKTSSNKGVIATNGKITPPVKATQVNLIFTVTKSTDGSTADTKSLSVTVPKAKGTSTSDIAAGIKSIKAPAAGATCLTMPSVPTGFTIVLKSSSNPGVIATDGTITSPVKATQVNLVFTVTKTTDSSTADTKSLSVTVPKGISARDIAAGIKSIKAPAAGATSLMMPSVPTGFTIVLKSSSNPGVIAIDGTITPPEKASKVNLVFTVTKTIDSSTAATKSLSVTVPKKKTTVSKASASILNVSSQPIPVHSVSTQAVPSLSALTSYRVMENSSSDQERISGVDRYGTAVEIAKNHFPAGAATVILARGDVAADALPAVPLAKKYKAPLLLTPYDALPSLVFTEIKELGATKVIIIGGEGAVSKNVADALTQVGITVNRVFGADHYGTAYEIAKILGNNEQAVIVNGDYTKSFPDALSISSWAAFKGVPILYADASDLIPQATEKAIKELGITKTILIGGTAVLPQSLTKVLPNAQRYAGQDLYETNIKVLSELQPNPVAIYATTGKDFSDALSIAAVAGLSNAWVLLTQSNGLTEEQMQLLRSANTGVSSFQVMGGTMVMPDKVLTQLQQILGKDIAKTDTNTDTSTNKGEETNNNQETNEDEDGDQNQNKEVVSKKGVATIAIDCQTAVDNGLHEQDRFKNAVPEDGIILQETSVDFKKSQTVFDILKRILAKKKIHMSYEGSKSTAYIQEINHLGEFDGGPTSGWMYSVNGDYPKVSCGACDVADGDVINWSYTCNLGVDLGQEIPED